MTDDCGFSLIEVLVALAMVGVLVAMVTLPLKQTDERRDYDRTLAAMEEIRHAVLGRQGLYCNGQRQFTGYVTDMGGLPALVDEDGTEVGDMLGEQDGEQVLLFPQPRALWTRDINGNGDTKDPEDIPDDLCWKYYEEQRIWAGWRGPYLDPPADGVLKDGWGNPFLFSDGEIITLKDETVVEYTFTSYVNIFGITVYKWTSSPPVAPGTYRCKTNWAFPLGPGSTSSIKSPLPGFATPYHGIASSPYDGAWDDCWEELPEAVGPPVIEPRENNEDPDTYRSIATNLFYGQGTLSVVSYGADGKPGGSGYNRDISMTIYPSEYTGEVAGMVGNSSRNFADYVSVCYPRFEQGKAGLVEWRHRIRVSGLEAGADDGCKNFRYGTAPHPGDTITQEDDWNTNIPVGIRSIRAEGTAGKDKIYVFTVEPTGNFIGTLRVRSD